DEMRARMFEGEKVDTNEMRQIADTLEKFLPAQPKLDPTPAIYKQDPYKVMEGILDRWLAADEEERAEQGLSPRIHDEQEQQRRIDELERENAELRGRPLANGQDLPAPEAERVITPTESEVIPPSEQSDHPRNQGYAPDLKDSKPPVTIDGKPLRPGMGP